MTTFRWISIGDFIASPFLAAYVLNISIELNMQTSYLYDVDLDRLPSYTLQMTF